MRAKAASSALLVANSCLSPWDESPADFSGSSSLVSPESGGASSEEWPLPEVGASLCPDACSPLSPEGEASAASGSVLTESAGEVSERGGLGGAGSGSGFALWP